MFQINVVQKMFRINVVQKMFQINVVQKMFQINVIQKIETHIFMFNFLFNRAVYENVEKYCRARHATDDNTAHAHCMLDT
jgi:hypothetical protein